jgi:hypothetical protein
MACRFRTRYFACPSCGQRQVDVQLWFHSLIHILILFQLTSIMGYFYDLYEIVYHLFLCLFVIHSYDLISSFMLTDISLIPFKESNYLGNVFICDLMPLILCCSTRFYSGIIGSLTWDRFCDQVSFSNPYSYYYLLLVACCWHSKTNCLALLVSTSSRSTLYSRVCNFCALKVTMVYMTCSCELLLDSILNGITLLLFCYAL